MLLRLLTLSLGSATITLFSPWPGLAVPAIASEALPQSQIVERLLQAFNHFAGPWANVEAIAGISWGQILLSALLLAMVAVSGEVLRAGLRRIARQKSPTAAVPAAIPARVPWITLTLEAVVAPLVGLLWIWGIYAMALLFFAEPGDRTEVPLRFGVLTWLKGAGELVVFFWFLFRMIHVIELGLQHWAAKTSSKWDDIFVAVAARALRLVVPLIGALLIVPTINLPVSSHILFKQAASLLLIGAVGFIFYELVNAVEQAVLLQFRIDVKNNLEARRIYTQVKVLKKIFVVAIVLFTAASMLMMFDSVRQLGTSILASAGVLGIVIGFAAQKSIATVVAGFQIAMTQPIRLDDVVIVENEWGRIEEITLTYVVVLIWDKRRLVLPITYFIEKPFQNWTRVSADLLGSVFLYVDYTVPLSALRTELDRLLEGSERWDQKVKVIQVTDAKANCMEVRVLVSAADAPTAWDLRCQLREQLIDFLQQNYPQSLPRVRAEVVAGDLQPQRSDHD